MFRLPKLNLGSFYKGFQNLTRDESLDTINTNVATTSATSPPLIRSPSPASTTISYQNFSPSPVGLSNTIGILLFMFYYL